jgi:glucose/arabinose dehydrogenase
MLITEKVGPVWLVTQDGTKTPVDNVPAVLAQGQAGMLGVFLSPNYATDHNVYLTYSEPGEGGSSLALARAKLALGKDSASPRRSRSPVARHAEGPRRQFGAAIAFSPTASTSSLRWATGNA